MKFDLNWQRWFLRKLCFNIMMGLQPWLKGQKVMVELIYSHCPIRLNKSSENNDWLQQFSKNQLFN